MTPDSSPSGLASTPEVASALERRDTPGLEAALTAVGCRDAGSIARDLTALADRPGLGAAVLDLASGWEGPADPELALRTLERIAGDPGAGEVLGGLAGDPALTRIHALLGGSAFLGRALSRYPAWLGELVRDVVRDEPPGVDGYRASIEAAIAEAGSLETGLRWAKLRGYARIAARDLAGAGTVSETVRDVSDLAEASLQVAVESIEAELVAEHGAPHGPSLPGRAVRLLRPRHGEVRRSGAQLLVRHRPHLPLPIGSPRHRGGRDPAGRCPCGASTPDSPSA